MQISVEMFTNTELEDMKIALNVFVFYQTIMKDYADWLQK